MNCKKYMKAYYSNYYLTHKKHIKEKVKEWQLLNSEKQLNYNKKYYYKHRKEILIKRKEIDKKRQECWDNLSQKEQLKEVMKFTKSILNQ